MKKKIVYIKGMHCASCENLLEGEFRNIEGVENVRANKKSGIVEIDYNQKEPNIFELKKTAEKFGYQLFENEQPSARTFIEWINAALIIIAIILLYRIFRDIGFLDKFNFGDREITYGVAFLIGLVASVSSCLIIVGSVIVAFGEKYRSDNNSGFYEGALKPNLFFHIGRLAIFFALGGVLGLIGGEISLSGRFISVFTIAVAVVLFWLGLNILRIAPSISNFGLRMPKAFSKKWENLKKSEHKAAPFLLGGLSFFLPCGFTQSMQIFALASGSFWKGGLSLLFFALGTFPSLLVLGTTVSWTKNKKMAAFQKVAGALIILFSFYTFNSGLALVGVKGNVLGGKSNEINVIQEEQSITGEQIGEQIVETRLGLYGFEPDVLKIKKGIPVKFIIKAEQVSGCTNRIIIPDLDIIKNINYGENIIKFIPDKTGIIDFSCWMGMVRGEFKVEK